MSCREAGARALVMPLSRIDAVPASLRGGVLAIGNFDGVHRGHRAVLDSALAEARGAGAPCVALTFEPHPRAFFAPDSPLFRLTPTPAKARLLAQAGLDGTLALRFDEGLAALDAEAFVARVLAGGLAARHVCVGYDFHFGRDRSGSPDFLRAAGARHGFGVTVAPPFAEAGGAVISSSAIREALAGGDIARANALLGYRWFVEGEVVHGDKRGRDLGYPTANLRLDKGVRLAHGIYAVRVCLNGANLDRETHDAVASFGRRPTFGDGEPLLEVHLFDFAGDLYGRCLTVEFIAFLRPEQRFDSAEALIAQMDRDSQAARAALER